MKTAADKRANAVLGPAEAAVAADTSSAPLRASIVDPTGMLATPFNGTNPGPGCCKRTNTRIDRAGTNRAPDPRRRAATAVPGGAMNTSPLTSRTPTLRPATGAGTDVSAGAGA